MNLKRIFIIFTFVTSASVSATADCLLNGAWFSEGSVVSGFVCHLGNFSLEDCLGGKITSVSPGTEACIKDFDLQQGYFRSIGPDENGLPRFCTEESKMELLKRVENRCLQSLTTDMTFESESSVQ